MSTITSRRKLLTLGGLGSIAAGVGLGQATAAQSNKREDAGPLSQATVAFGAWMANAGVDRMSPAFDPITANHHLVAPNQTTIKAGGAISFAISGFHQIIVYGNGMQPGNISPANLVLSQGPAAPPFPILIDDPNNRIYRGADPGGQPLDRVETVHFAVPGTYLVICGIVFHFVNDNMHGFVKVLP
jgi:hypothetical protein